MPEKPPIDLTIAGFDPSSGAGVTADIKTIAAHNCYGVVPHLRPGFVTVDFRRPWVKAIDPALISDTLEELALFSPIAAVAIGMLGVRAKVVKAWSPNSFRKPPSARSGDGTKRPDCRILCLIPSLSPLPARNLL